LRRALRIPRPERRVMMRMIAIVLLAVGVLALAYGGFSYTRQTHDAKIGPLEISVTEKERVNVPVWAGVALVVVGAGLLLTQKK
jgi:TRAP-type C4-dicarboxylate transport system permease small subunit